MNKILITMIAVVSLLSCAGCWMPQKRWNAHAQLVNPGTSRDQLIKTLGPPDATFTFQEFTNRLDDSPGEFDTGLRKYPNFRALVMEQIAKQNENIASLPDSNSKPLNPNDNVVFYDESKHFRTPYPGPWKVYLYGIRDDQVCVTYMVYDWSSSHFSR